MRISSDRDAVVQRLEARGIRRRRLIGLGPELEGFDTRTYYDIDPGSGAVVLWKNAGNIASAPRVHLQFSSQPEGTDVTIQRASWWASLRSKKVAAKSVLGVAASIVLMLVVLGPVSVLLGFACLAAGLSIRAVFGLRGVGQSRELENAAYAALAPDELGLQPRSSYRLRS